MTERQSTSKINNTDGVTNIDESTIIRPTHATIDKKRIKPGILRLDISKPRRSSGGSVEFRNQPELLGEDSPSVPSSTTSPPQLSVTWAAQCDINDRDSIASTQNSRQMQNIIKLQQEKAKWQHDDRSRGELSPNELTSPKKSSDGNNSEEEDYSLSVNAIMQRRASIRAHRKKSHRGSRRTSSPMDHVLDPVGHLGDRRRSSVYTTSSGDTAISLDDGTNQDSSQEQIYENIRLHKEVIQSVKFQPWSVRRKLKLVRQAKTYVARHEGVLQERFAMNRSTKDLWARFKILMAARWRHWKREIASFLTVLIPWELRIKEIESHFGSGVASYFTFLRWLLWVNIMIAIPLLSFVIIPELLASDHSVEDTRKTMTPGELKKAGNILTIWEFDGYLKYSPLFYGFYSDKKSGAIRWGYNLPLAYFLTSVLVYVYSFVATLRKMADNSRTSKLSSKDDECVFSWKLFTGWDFMIGHAETAHNRIASVVVGFKEALLEEAEKKKDKRNWRIILQRILVNIVVTALLAASGYTVVLAVDRSENADANSSWMRRNEVNVIMTLLSFVLPMMFDVLGVFESWHPRQQLRLQLARIMILNLLNLYSLMFSFIYKKTGNDGSYRNLRDSFRMAKDKREYIKRIIRNFTENINEQTTNLMNSMDWITTEISTFTDNLTTAFAMNLSDTTISEPSTITTITSSSTTMELFNQTQCYWIHVNCNTTNMLPKNNLTVTTLILLTTTILPQIFPTTIQSAIMPRSTTDLPKTTPEITEPSIILKLTTQLPTTITTTDYDYDDYETNDGMTTTAIPTTTTAKTITTSEDYYIDLDKGNDSYFIYADYFDNIESPDDDDIDNFDASIDNEKNNNKDLNKRYKRIISALSSSEVLDKTDQNNDIGMTTTTSVTTTTTTELTSVDIDKLNKHINEVYESLSRSLSEEYGYDPHSIYGYDKIQVPEKRFNLTNIFQSTLSTFIDNITTTIASNERIHDDKLQEFLNNLTTTISGSLDENLSTDDYDLIDGENCTTKWVCSPIMPVTEPMDGSTTLYPPVKDLNYYERENEKIELTLLEIRKNLSTMCWETSLGQELSKVIVFDAMMSIAAPLCIDFVRALFVRYMNDHWCWDMEKTFPQYGDFKIAESILNLVYNQGQVWMGIFFSPGLVIINLVKLIILMYLRSWIVLTCNVPHEVVFKASKSNNFYLSLLLTMLFLCVLPVGYAIVWLRPSWHCGPFSKYTRISEFFTNTTRNALPKTLHKPLEYMTSSSTVIPLLLLLILIIYYLVSLTGALREANQDLRTQLQKERMEERKKIFKIPEDKPAETSVAAITSRWRKVLDASSPITPTGPGGVQQDPEEQTKMLARKELLSRIMRKALRKGSVTSEDDSLPMHGNEDDETDTEHHDPLPHDEEHKKRHGSRFPKLYGNKRTRKPSLIDIVTLARKDSGNETHPKSLFKVNRDNADHDNYDTDENTRMITDQRTSLLKRKPKLGEIPSNDQSTDADPNSNYEIINEKSTEVEKKSKQKETNIFKFDLKNLKAAMKSDSPPAAAVPAQQSQQLQKKSITDVLFKAHPAENSSGPSSPNIIERAQASGGEKLAALSRQGRKRIGSFLALVKEAVNKKTDGIAGAGDQSDDSPNQTSCDTPESPLPPTTLQQEPTTNSQQTAVIAQIEIQPPAQGENEDTQLENDDNNKQTTVVLKSVTERKLTKEKMPPSRQDSQTSIPVITISATGSEECILECSDKDDK